MVTGPGANELKFTGKRRDTESQLDYFGARYYAGSMGRWISPDWSAYWIFGRFMSNAEVETSHLSQNRLSRAPGFAPSALRYRVLSKFLSALKFEVTQLGT